MCVWCIYLWSLTMIMMDISIILGPWPWCIYACIHDAYMYMILDPDACVYDEDMNDADIHDLWPLCMYLWCSPFLLRTNEPTNIMHVCIMHVSWYLCVWCIYSWSLILNPQSLNLINNSMMHVCMMHIYMILVPDPDACMYDAWTHDACKYNVCMDDACTQDAGIYEECFYDACLCDACKKWGRTNGRTDSWILGVGYKTILNKINNIKQYKKVLKQYKSI